MSTSAPTQQPTFSGIAQPMKAFHALMAILSVIIYWVFHARYAVMPDADLDPSWEMALLNAIVTRTNFAFDFIYNYGPYGYFILPNFHPDLYKELVLSRLFFISVCILAGLVFRKVYLLLAFLAIAIIFTGNPSILSGRDSFFFISIGYISYLIFFPSTTAVKTVTKCLSLLLLAFLSHGKFSFLFLALPLIVLADISLLLRKHQRFLWNSTIFILAFVVLFLAAADSIMDLPAYLINIVDISSEYAKAMQIFYNWPTGIIIFLTLIATAVLHLLRAHYSALHCPKALTIIYGLAAIWFLFIPFKAGYVRSDDSHACTTWLTYMMLLILLSMYVFVEADWLGNKKNKTAAALLSPLLVIMIWNPVGIRWKLLNNSAIIFMSTNHQIGLPGPHEYDDLNTRYHLRASELAGTFQLKGCNSIDSWTWDLTQIILKGGYIGRPIPQSFVAYHPRLQELNSIHLRDHGPDCALVKIKTIDARYDTLDIGRDLAELQSHYDFDSVINTTDQTLKGALLLRRAPREHKIVTDGEHEIETRIGEWTELPPSNTKFRFAQVFIEPNILAKVTTLFYVEPPVWIEAIYKSGTKSRYRFIPSLGKSRFTLSPNYAAQPSCYFVSCPNAVDFEVAKIRFVTFGGSLFFDDKIGIKLTEYHIES